MISVILSHFFQCHALTLAPQSVHVYKFIQKYNTFDFRNRIHYKFHIYIIAVFINSHSCFSNQICSNCHGMHLYKCFFRNFMKIIFPAIFHTRKRMSVLNTHFPGLLINPEKIAPDNICVKFFQAFHKPDKSFFIYPVITVQYLYIFSGSMVHSCIDRRSMSAIWLTDHTDRIRMCCHILHCNLFRPVRRSVQNHQYFYFIQNLSDHQRFQALTDVLFHIVHWNDN